MKKFFTSLDRSLSIVGEYLAPDRHREMLGLAPSSKYIVQGAGVSYVPLSFGSGATVVSSGSFDRILRFDPDKSEIEVEAGISLSKLFGFLREKGFFLPVQPGHPQITVGGCIACNVHGKNQFREGLFGDHLKEMTLFHPRRGTFRVSPSQSPDLFQLTCGGFGLTGVILSAVLSIRRIPGSSVLAEYVPIEDLVMGAKSILELEEKSDLLYSWHDLGPWNDYRGNGFIVRGAFSAEPSPEAPSRSEWQELPLGKRTALPFGLYTQPAIFFLNAGLRAYYLKWKKSQSLSLFDFSFPISSKVLYYSLYGPAGFMEHQVLIPRDRAFSYLEQFRLLAQRQKPRIALSSMKAFAGKGRLLNFSGNGLCFSIDLPRSPRSLRFLADLDRIDIEHGAKANVVKDSRVSKESVAAEYPEYQKFRDELRRYDSERLFASELSERLDL